MSIEEFIGELNEIKRQYGNLKVEVRIMASDGVVWRGDLTKKYLWIDKPDSPKVLEINAVAFDKSISTKAKHEPT